MRAAAGTLRTVVVVAAVAAAGAVGTLLVGAALGMHGDELAHLLQALALPGLATVAVAALAAPVMARASLRQRFLAVGVLASAVSLTNVFVLTMQMSVSQHDATLVTVLLVYATGVGVAAALAVARGSAAAVRRLEETALRLGEGDLDARTGPIAAGPELEMLARALDEMASRLQDAQGREREAESMRRDLITTVSHDLRTPLASLRAMVEAIDDGVVDDPPSMRRYAAEMRRSVDQLVNLVDDLFELTQLEAGAIAAETRRARLGDVVRSAVAAVELQASQKGLALSTELGETADVPCSPRIARVLTNLLTNAVRHTPADGSVRLTASRDANSVHLAVEDTGEGIAADDLPRVFEPFFRADPSRSGSGAGLGLALAKRIVEALGGRISVASGPGPGARFDVELPV